MKRWLAFALLLATGFLLPGCFTASRETTSGRAPRTLSPDRETAEPAVGLPADSVAAKP